LPHPRLRLITRHAHPYVGQLLFSDPTAIDPRFDDPGGWFNCTGTLVSPTTVVTAGHCTFGTGRNGEPTTSGSAGNDVWIGFAEVPDTVVSSEQGERRDECGTASSDRERAEVASASVSSVQLPRRLSS
jgi:V8-like Glu-specific endopeptidase